MDRTTACQIGNVTFDFGAQELFASISSDRNPIHLNSLAARRLQAGCQVVHGVHVLLKAIELWRNDRGSSPASVNGAFLAPICVGEEVVFLQRLGERSANVVEATVNGTVCARITIIADPSAPGPSRVSQGVNLPSENVFLHDRIAVPLDNDPRAHLGKTYVIPLDQGGLLHEFPASSSYFGEVGVSAILALTYFVGMVCPGLNSLFSSVCFEPTTGSPKGGPVSFTVRKFDPRFRLFEIDFDGPIRGSLKAFMRLPAQAQLSLGEVQKHIAPDEFSGTKALVIGGSRGLGELTAKILAAGAGEVLITYASGLDDAARVRDEINASGPGTCVPLRLDCTRDSFESLGVDFKAVNIVFFYATPRIFARKHKLFELSRFTEFCEFYVNWFYEMCAALEQASGTDKKVKVFFPSSSAVAQRPKGMVEYSMAKAAAEILVEEINRTFRRVSVLTARLPRLQSDQTASLISVPTESNLETLLPIIRAIAGRARES